MPITLVITDLDVGGAERSLVSLCLGLDRSRWRPFVICLTAEGRLAEPLREAGVSVTCLGCNPRRPLQAIFRLASALRSSRVQIVQSFLFHANFATKLASLFAGRPWVVGGIRVAEREKSWHRTLEWLTQRMSTGAVCVSEGVRRFSEEVGGLAVERLVVIPNGVDPTLYDSADALPKEQLGFQDGSRLMLFVGRLTTQKGVSILIEAFCRIAVARPNWNLAIVGDGTDREALEQLARPLVGRIRFLGRRDDVPSLLKTSDLVVLPSLWEGMPNVVMEAMAAGRAVCVTDVEGIAELVNDQTGWVARPGDLEDFALKLLDATADDAPRDQYGENAREVVRSRFQQSAVVAAYDRLWSGVLGA